MRIVITLFFITIASVIWLYYTYKPSHVVRNIPIFVINHDSIYVAINPNKKITLGEPFNLKQFKSRFSPDCTFSKIYLLDEMGTNSVDMFCYNNTIEISILSNDGVEVSRIYSRNKEVAYLNNIRTGEALSNAIGTVAYCNLCSEDELSFCTSKHAPSIKFITTGLGTQDESCKFTPSAKYIDELITCVGVFNVPQCARIEGIQLESFLTW